MKDMLQISIQRTEAWQFQSMRRILPRTSLIFHKMQNNLQLYKSSDPGNTTYHKHDILS